MASKSHRSRARRNPTGTILVNPGRLTLRGAIQGKRHNPITIGNPKLRKGSAAAKRHMAKLRSMKLRNPITIGNPKLRKGARRNPITIGNPSRIAARASGYIGQVQSMFRKLPLVGGVLAVAIGGIGAALGGAVGVLPSQFALVYVGKYLPVWAKPYAYTAAGLVLSGVVKAIPMDFPGKNALAIGMSFAGGAVDMYRYRHGQSMSLAGDEMGDYDSTYEIGEDEIGEDGLGDDGAPFAAAEFADADIGDYQYAGDDLSGEEIAAAEMGRAHFRRKFVNQYKKQAASSDGDGGGSDDGPAHAGMPGGRWGWLIYWIGMENFQKLSKMPEAERKDFIAKAKHMAMTRTTKLLEQGVGTDMVNAEVSGILIAA